MTTAGSRLSQSKIFIDDTSGLSILELRAKARRYRREHQIEAIFIDYLQLLRSPTRRAQDNRQLEIAEISFGLKALALIAASADAVDGMQKGALDRLVQPREAGVWWPHIEGLRADEISIGAAPARDLVPRALGLLSGDPPS